MTKDAKSFSIASLREIGGLVRERPLSVPDVLRPNHLPSLDGFRGIAILLVLIEHAYYGLLRPFHGNYGVYIFFGISGFLITTLLLKEKVDKGNISLKHFYVRRFLRIFPVAYLYIAVVIALNFVFRLEYPVSGFLSAALYVENTSLFNSPGLYLSHYWSLSIEEQFYLLFPFMIKKSIRGYVIVIFLLFMVIPVISYLDITGRIQSFAVHVLNEVLQYMPALLMGSLFSVLMISRVIVLNATIRFRSFVVLLLLICAGYLIANPGILMSTSVSFTVAYFLIALMIMFSLTPGNDLMYQILNSRILATIGVYSYSIYIWQQIFTKHRPWAGSFPGSDSDVLNFVALALVSYLSYNFYEKKFLQMKKKFR